MLLHVFFLILFYHVCLLPFHSAISHYLVRCLLLFFEIMLEENNLNSSIYVRHVRLIPTSRLPSQDLHKMFVKVCVHHLIRFFMSTVLLLQGSPKVYHEIRLKNFNHFDLNSFCADHKVLF